MIDFKSLTPVEKKAYNTVLMAGSTRGCEYSFTNLYLWGRQKIAQLDNFFVIFSQFNRRSVYPFPVGSGNLKPVIDAIIQDAHERGIPCRITGMNAQDMSQLEQLYPQKFRFHCDRDFYDYVYAIEDLADLKGRKYQKKRNHYNRFRTLFPHYTVHPLTDSDLPDVAQFVELWYARRKQEDPQGDYHMEHAALTKALRHWRELEMEALLLKDGKDILAFTMGSRMGYDTFDIHFEKAHPDADGAYPAINCEFARYLRQKYPQVKFLNREDDMGLEGLRKAKMSYCPHHLVEKCWACLLEDGYDY